MLSMLPPGSSCDGGGEEQQASCLAAKQAVEFPLVLTINLEAPVCIIEIHYGEFQTFRLP